MACAVLLFGLGVFSVDRRRNRKMTSGAGARGTEAIRINTVFRGMVADEADCPLELSNDLSDVVTWLRDVRDDKTVNPRSVYSL